ncbi:MAG TPA: hypothetical protein VFW75_03880, partial [Acetobacteraceae bacterium]|nr:hypothetical protein [Acetobacteraceae bacterium]
MTAIIRLRPLPSSAFGAPRSNNTGQASLDSVPPSDTCYPHGAAHQETPMPRSYALGERFEAFIDAQVK